MPSSPSTFRPFGRTPKDHQREYEQARGSPSKRGYGRDWQRVRAEHLKMEPVCRFCRERGDVVAAEVVDHIKTIEERPDLRLVHDNLRSLCLTCHNTRTAIERRTGRLPPP